MTLQNRKTMENIIIGLIFLSAIAYLGNIVYQNFNPKNKAGCAKGCGSCGAIDFDKIASQMESHK
jgi:FeoB-associated Cys-rich membrane protein